MECFVQIKRFIDKNYSATGIRETATQYIVKPAYM